MAVKGVILAAGYGSRFLPVTRCVPKEMLPIVDRPAIDHVVREFVDAGIEDVLVITSRRKRAIEDWFDRDPELEALFTAEGDDAKLARIRPPAVRATFVRQQVMRGTGEALLLAREFAGGDPVVLAFPDDLFGEPNCTAELVRTWERTGASVLSAADLSGEDVSRYGVIEPSGEEDGIVRVRRVVEKPRPGTEPSSLVSLGRYLFAPDIFPALAEGLAAHEGPGEYFATEGINRLAERGGVVARVVTAPRYDTGKPLGYLQAIVELALQHEEIGEAFGRWLHDRFAG